MLLGTAIYIICVVFCSISDYIDEVVDGEATS